MDVAPVSYPGQALPAVPDTASPNWLVENRELIRSIKSIDAAGLFGEGSELTFALDRDTKRPVVRIVNPQTGEILWQAPPEYMLRLAQTLGRHRG
jgi:uncharacterized FlaG/YvyC family protein